jgi:hypothetical protein
MCLSSGDLQFRPYRLNDLTTVLGIVDAGSVRSL